MVRPARVLDEDALRQHVDLFEHVLEGTSTIGDANDVAAFLSTEYADQPLTIAVRARLGELARRFADKLDVVSTARLRLLAGFSFSADEQHEAADALLRSSHLGRVMLSRARDVGEDRLLGTVIDLLVFVAARRPALLSGVRASGVPRLCLATLAFENWRVCYALRFAKLAFIIGELWLVPEYLVGALHDGMFAVGDVVSALGSDDERDCVESAIAEILPSAHPPVLPDAQVRLVSRIVLAIAVCQAIGARSDLRELATDLRDLRGRLLTPDAEQIRVLSLYAELRSRS